MNKEQKSDNLNSYKRITGSIRRIRASSKTPYNRPHNNYSSIVRYMTKLDRITVKETGKDIKHIYHMGDIHIRKSTRRHNEYNKVFENLYKKILNDKYSTETSVVVICGDILHEKCNYNEISLQIIFNLMERLVSLMDVIVIMGNHDGYTLRENRRDALKPILDRIQGVHDLYYFRDSGIYEYENLVFGVSSIYDNKFIRADYIDSKRIKIALYHGSVTGSKMQNEYILDKYDRRVEEFRGYDYVMLGDIHKHQYLDKRRRVAYSSSLIQQNHGEDLEDHGYILWDIESGKSEFKRVSNEYGYITIKIEEGKIVEEPKKYPNEVRMRVKYMKTNKSECDKLLNDLSKERKITYISTEYLEEYERQNPNGLELLRNGNDINKVEYQNKLIVKFCEDKLNLKDDMIKKIIELNIELNAGLDTVDINEGVQWFPLNMRFSNMFAYGEGNEIDFRKLKGITGIIGPNHYGKSSILDIILFVLFDRCSRSTIRKDIMNTDKSNFYCELTLVANNTVYEIVRKAKATKKSIRVEVDLYEIVKGERICKTGKDRNETNMKISELVGMYNDFIMTYISLQKVVNFTDLNQSERVDYLVRLSGLDILDRLYKKGNKVKNKSNDKCEILELDDEKDKVSIEELLEEKRNILDSSCDTTNEIKIKQKEISDIDSEIDELNSEKYKVGNVCTDVVDELTAKNYRMELKKLCELMNIANEEQKKLENQYGELKREYNDENICGITDAYNLWLKNKTEKEEEINSLIKSKRSTMITRNENEIMKDKEGLTKNMTDIDKKKNSTIFERDELKDIVINEENIIRMKYDELCELKSKVEKMKSDEDIIIVEIRRLKNVGIEYKNYRYDKECEFCCNNPFTKEAVESIKKISETKNEQKKLTSSINSINDTIKTLKTYEDEYLKLEEDKIYNDDMKKKRDILDQKLLLLEKDIEVFEHKIKIIDGEENIFNMNKEIINDNKKIEIKMSDLENKIKEGSKIVNKYNIMIEVLEKCDKNQKNIFENKCKILKLDKHCADIDRKLLDYDKNKENIQLMIQNSEINEKINEEIKVLRERKVILLEDMEYNRDKQINLACSSHSIDLSVAKQTKLEKDLKYHRDVFECAKIYTDIMHRKGLPFYLIDTLISDLEHKTNRLLSNTNMTDFTIKIHKYFMKDRTGIDFYKIVDDKQLNILNCSGYEQFIVNLMIRLSMIKISNRCSTTFLALDEGFSCMDDDNLHKLDLLFNYLRREFTFVLLVSHLDELKSNCDKYINIVKPSLTTSFVKYI
jgi:predicted phosphodiesterase/ABC-type branched-subunit amino acid transport system ATPase component